MTIFQAEVHKGKALGHPVERGVVERKPRLEIWARYVTQAMLFYVFRFP